MYGSNSHVPTAVAAGSGGAVLADKSGAMGFYGYAVWTLLAFMIVFLAFVLYRLARRAQISRKG